jgi:hypothetical protein
MVTPLPVMTRFTLNALIDDFPLTAQRFDPPEGVPLRAAAVISCATGIDAKLYKDFASYAVSSSHVQSVDAS